MWAWLFAACAPDSWSDDAVLAPTLARLDADHDGKVTAAEWNAAAQDGPKFEKVDTDHDKTLSLAELVAYNAATDPLTAFNPFHAARPDGKPPKGHPVAGPNAPVATPTGTGGPPNPTPPPAGSPPPNAPPGTTPIGGPPPESAGPDPTKSEAQRTQEREQRSVHDTLAVLRAEVEGKVPPETLPTDEELTAAAEAGTLDDPRCRAVLVRLDAAWSRAGLTLPASLRPAPP